VPDLRYTKSAVETVGKNLKQGATVVLESTVYPGVTEEIVKHVLERESKMKCGIDFYIGYSPERINPGDEAHALTKITKIVAGMDKLFCKQKPLLKIAYAIFCFAKRNISLVTLSFLKKGLLTCEDCLMRTKQKEKGFIIGGCETKSI